MRSLPSIRSSSLRAAAITILLLFGRAEVTPAAYDPSETEELVKGILARADAVFSARLAYMQSSRIEATGQGHTSSARLSFSGTSWIRREDKGGGVVLSHKGKKLMYIEHPQSGGGVIRQALVNPPERMDVDSPFPPYFGGTFWHERTKTFLQTNAARAKYVGVDQVNGTEIKIVELPVTRDEVFKALRDETDLGIDGGKLRIGTSPALGYALPLVEFVGTGDKVMSRFEAWDFKQAGDNLYFPQRLRLQDFNSKGLLYTLRYEITRIESLNEPIPDSEFQIELPTGTVVDDSRSLTHSESFFVGARNAQVSPDLNEVIAGLPPPGKSRSVAKYVAFGCALGICIAFLYLLRRYYYSGLKTPRGPSKPRESGPE